MLPATKYPNNSRTVIGPTVNVFSDDVILLCDTSVTSINIFLQEYVPGFWNTLYKLYIFDSAGNAGTNNITITPPAGYNINNTSSLVLNSNGAGVIIRIGDDTNYVGTITVGAGGGHIIQEEGTSLPQRKYLNFVGAGVVATDSPGTDQTIITISGGGSGSTYTNLTPTPAALGGIPAGSTFVAQTLQQMFDALLYPYQTPAFTSFAMSGQATALEAGDSVAGGSRTFTWSTSNPTNITTNSIAIKDVTGAVTLGTGLTNTGSSAENIGTAKTVMGVGSYTWSIEATNTQSTLFSTTFTVNWYFREFYGTSANTSLTAAQIQALVNQPLASSIPGSYAFVANDYKYLAFPDYLGIINTITLGGFGVAMADASDGYTLGGGGGTPNYMLVSVTNTFAVMTNYKVYRTKNTIVGAVTFSVT